MFGLTTKLFAGNRKLGQFKALVKRDVIGELTDAELEGVAGGQFVTNPVTTPDPFRPKFGPPNSIAGGELGGTLGGDNPLASNSTDNNLPQNGGGVIK